MLKIKAKSLVGLIGGSLLWGSLAGVLPLMAKDININLDSSPPSALESPAIELFSPGEATITSQSEIIVKGLARNATQLKVNGLVVAVDPVGQFQTTVKLPNLGTCAIEVDATNKNGEQDTVFRSVQRVADDGGKTVGAVGPELSILQPENSFTTSKEKAFVKGVAVNATRLLINDRPTDLSSDGKFNDKVPLASGQNKIHFVAYTAKGASSEAWRTITRSGSATGADKVSDRPQYISLNLVDTDIQQIINILTEKTGINFVGDSSLKGNVTLHLKDIELTEALNIILKANGYDYQRVGNTIFIAHPERVATFKTQLIQVFQLKNIKAADAAAILKNFINTAENESIQESADENLLIIKAGESSMKRVENILEQVDRSKPQQALIEVKVAEISRTNLDHFGLDWKTSGVQTSYAVPLQSPIREATLSGLGLSVGLDTLFSQGNAHVLATPRLSALNNKKASIFIGDEVSYTTSTTSSSGTSTTVEKVDVGIKLDMTPVINPVDNSVIVEIATEVSFISSFINNVPQLQTRKASTTLRINDGDTGVIGGLLSSKDSVTKAGIPVLGQLPILGTFFSTNVQDKDERELIITITPQIVR